MKIVTVSFGDEFRRMADVLQYSAARHCPDAVFVRHDIPSPESVPQRLDFCVHNSVKLDLWCRAIDDAHDRVVFMDADTLILGPLDDAFDGSFDVAYTSRPGVKWLNGGVFFADNTDAARSFVHQWRDRNQYLMDNPDELDPRLHRCGGVNQAALMDLLTGQALARIGCLPCARWNSVDQTWWAFDRDTRVVHLKGKLRRAALDGQSFNESIDEIARIWNQYAEQSKHETVQ